MVPTRWTRLFALLRGLPVEMVDTGVQPMFLDGITPRISHPARPIPHLAPPPRPVVSGGLTRRSPIPQDGPLMSPQDPNSNSSMMESPRVQLRRLTLRDALAEKWIATDMANFTASPNPIMDYYQRYPHFGTGWLGIVDPTSNLLVGRAGLLSRSDIFHPAELEMAYVIQEEHQKKGFAKESAALLLDYARQHPSIPRVFLGMAPEHTASIRIAESLGLKPEYCRPHFSKLHVYYWFRKSGTFSPEQFA
jgi:RimJ/RimL family protein N-acetyltransferase